MSRRQEFDLSRIDWQFQPAGPTHTPPDTSKSDRWNAANRPSAPEHQLAGVIDGQTAVTLDWNPHHGMVNMVRTHPDYRGHGLASAAWGAAHVHAARHGLVPPRHSDVKLPDGKHWANKQTVQSGPGKKQPPRPRLSRKPGPGQMEFF